VLSGRGLCDELITRPEESYRLWCVIVCDLETSKMRRPWPALGRSATAKKKCLHVSTLQCKRDHTVCKVHLIWVLFINEIFGIDWTNENYIYDPFHLVFSHLVYDNKMLKYVEWLYLVSMREVASPVKRHEHKFQNTVLNRIWDLRWETGENWVMIGRVIIPIY